MEKAEILSLMKKVFLYTGTADTDDFNPPHENIFSNNAHTIMIDGGGGDIIETEPEDRYHELMNVLKAIGETEYYIVQDNFPLAADTFDFYTVPVDSTKEALHKVYEALFASPCIMDNLFVFGNSGKWAIYADDRLMVNYISCEPEYAELFVKVMDIQPDAFDKWHFAKQFELISELNTQKYPTAEAAKAQFKATYINSPHNYFNNK